MSMFLGRGGAADVPGARVTSFQGFAALGANPRGVATLAGLALPLP